MKLYLSVIVFCILGNFCHAQNDSLPLDTTAFQFVPASDDQPCTVVEVMPEFPGGIEKMMKFIRKHLSYPASARKDSIVGKVYIKFVVDREGYVRDVRAAPGTRAELGEASTEAIKKMPRWKPGRQGGVPVSVYYVLPVNFSLSNTKK